MFYTGKSLSITAANVSKSSLTKQKGFGSVEAISIKLRLINRFVDVEGGFVFNVFVFEYFLIVC